MTGHDDRTACTVGEAMIEKDGMRLWYRVFGRSGQTVALEDLVRELQRLDPDAEARFKTDDRGWYHAELRAPELESPLILESYWQDEEGIRHQLQSWAAWLETCADNPHHQPLMERIIGTQQIFTISRPAEAENAHLLDRVCLTACRFLAQTTDGIYQVDRQGLYDAEGRLLVAEN
jgi:hypothetical protein